jgi:hypothetical protein
MPEDAQNGDEEDEESDTQQGDRDSDDGESDDGRSKVSVAVNARREDEADDDMAPLLGGKGSSSNISNSSNRGSDMVRVEEGRGATDAEEEAREKEQETEAMMNVINVSAL